jgi:NlpC/P60 family
VQLTNSRLNFKMPNRWLPLLDTVRRTHSLTFHGGESVHAHQLRITSSRSTNDRSSPAVICPGSETRIKIFAVQIKKLLAISIVCILAVYSASSADKRQAEATLEAAPISGDDGLSIIAAALDLRVSRSAKQDCSHLVHTIYKRAGFSYIYARSSDLYNGVENFQRVAEPQPGDLVVWRGHVGIVVNPAQHAFFSSMRSGLGVDDYQAPYWNKRGRARFYRYIANNPVQEMVATKPLFRPTEKEQ